MKTIHISSHITRTGAALVFGLCAMMASAGAYAASTSPGTVIVIPQTSDEWSRPTAIALVQTADYVCASLDISSRKKDQGGQIDEIRQTLKALAQETDKSQRLTFHNGPVRFSPIFSKFSSSPSNIQSKAFDTEARVSILHKLTSDSDDVLSGSRALREFVDTFRASTQADVRLTRITLAVESPERQRQRILQLIKDSADAMKNTFAASSVSIEGLEGPVLVRQINDTQVELYIDYKLTVVSQTGK